MLESTIEKYLVDKVKKAGGIAYKFTSPARRSVPDRLVLIGDDGYTPPTIVFVELKAPGKKPTPSQTREHARIRALGFRVEVIDSKDGVDEFMNSLI